MRWRGCSAATRSFADVPIEARFHCNKRGMPDLLEGRITPARLPREAARLLVAPGPRRRPAPRPLQPAHRARFRRPPSSASRSAYADDPIARLPTARSSTCSARSPQRHGKPGLVEMSSHNVREAQTLRRLFPRGARHPRAARRPRLRRRRSAARPGDRDTIVAGIDWWAERLRAIDAGRPRRGGRRRLRDPLRPLPRRPARRARRRRARAAPTPSCWSFLGVDDERGRSPASSRPR